MKITGRQNLECKIKTEVRALLPRSPKTNCEPAKRAEEPGHRVSGFWKKALGPISIFSTKMAKATCRPRPQTTVFLLMGAGGWWRRRRRGLNMAK